MLIENVDALKTWLTKSLTPICDADPTALAKYVVALIKKDKTEAELKDSCNDQLDVFLQKDTKSFVDNFFEVLKNKSYIKETEAPPTVTSTTSTRTSESKNDTKRSKSKERKKSESEPVDDDERDFRRRRSRSGSPRGRSSERRRFDDRPRRGYDRDRRRDRLDDRRRSRSRSRSPWRPTDRGPRRSPEKEGAHPEFDARNYRVPDGNHSGPPVAPPPPDSRGADWNRDGYRGEQRPPPPPRRPRCRDYDEKGFCMRGDMCPFDHGVDPVIVEDVNLPNVLAFPGPNQTAPGGPPVGQGPRGPPPGPMPRGPPPPQMRPQPPPPGTGGMPQHMHHGMPPRPNMPHPPRQGPPPGPPQGQGPRPMMGNRNEPYEPEPYNPEAPNLSGRRPPPPGPGQHGQSGSGFWAPPRGPRPPAPYQPQAPPRPSNPNLVSVPTVQPQTQSPPESTSNNARRVIAKRNYEEADLSSEKSYDHGPGQSRSGPPYKRGGYRGGRGGFDFSRLGRKRDTENATLEVRKIPQEFNNMGKLNEHFGKFGTLVNLQICYGGDQDAALVTFASNAEANAAYRSSEPVFNNRFIKVFWHNKDKQEGQGHGQGQTQGQGQQTKEPVKPSLKDRLGSFKVNNTKPAEPTEKTIIHTAAGGGLTKTVYNPSALKTKAVVNTKVNELAQQREALRKKQEQSRKEAVQKRLQIQKQKQTLLQKQLEQQKLLIQKLEQNKSMSATEKAAIMKTIKTLASSIEKLKKELTPTKAEPVHKTKQEAQKELLDTELELMNQESAGGDTTDLRVKILELRREAASLGLLESRGRGRGRGRGVHRGRGRGRGAAVVPGARSVDRRPKQLLVSGFFPEEKEELVNHFKVFGEIENVDHDDNIPSVVLTYKTRMEAEMAVTKGQKFKSRNLSMSWYKPGETVKKQVSHEEEEEEDGGGHEELDDELDEDILLGGDDEDEDDEEDDRSWRR